MSLPGWRDVEIGFMLSTPGTAAQYRSGDWRSQRPVWDNDRCIKCGICYIFCPDMAVRQREDGYFEANLFYCKGCGICYRECWTGAIHMEEEVD